MEGETDSDPMATVHKLLYEFEAKNLNTLKQKAEMEQEITVLRKTLSSRGEEERRKAKDLECMRETMKNLSEKNKFLAKELERKIDAEAECVAIKSAASKVQKENELLKNEVARLKKQFVAAESRADENAYILSKVTTSRGSSAAPQVDENAHVLSKAPTSRFVAVEPFTEENSSFLSKATTSPFVAAETRADENAHILSKVNNSCGSAAPQVDKNVHILSKTPASRFVAVEPFTEENSSFLSKATTSPFVAAETRADENAHILSKATSSRANFYKHIQEQADVSNVQSTPRPVLKQRAQSLTRTERADSGYREHLGRKPSPIRSLYETPISRFRPSTSKDDTISRKRGVMLDYCEPVNRRKLDFKLQKLSGNNKRRQLDHLKSHYDPATGSYDQSHGESPKSAAKLSTPKKENRILDSILRKK